MTSKWPWSWLSEQVINVTVQINISLMVAFLQKKTALPLSKPKRKLLSTITAESGRTDFKRPSPNYKRLCGADPGTNRLQKLRLDVENCDRRYTAQRLQANMSINYHMWLHYYTTHSAQIYA